MFFDMIQVLRRHADLLDCKNSYRALDACTDDAVNEDLGQREAKEFSHASMPRRSFHSSVNLSYRLYSLYSPYRQATKFVVCSHSDLYCHSRSVVDLEASRFLDEVVEDLELLD